MSGAYLRAGETAGAEYALDLMPERAGWTYSGLRVLELDADGVHELATGDDELIVLPLEGSATVEVDGERFELAGRESVFAAVTDFAYAPRDARVTIASGSGGRFALPSARAQKRLEPRHVAAAGRRRRAARRRPGEPPGQQLLLARGVRGRRADRRRGAHPGGQLVLLSPHKHDERREGETELEEIYYFEVAREGFGYQRVYGSGTGREIDITAEVRSGDAIVMPHGYHGPSMAAPGYDLYYLNVMAGPERAWRFTDDPQHAWIRGTWEGQALDPRLPLTSPRRDA